MLDLLIWGGVFILSLFVLIRASAFLTDSAEKIGISLGISAFVVGVTIVAVGTSLPELISSIFAVLSGSSEIVIGNVVGSNITNIFLILGIAGLIARKKLIITRNLVQFDLPVLVGSAFLLLIMVWDGVFTLFESILSLTGMVIYTLYLTKTNIKGGRIQIKREIGSKKKIDIKVWMSLILSSVFIFIGARYMVESILELSKILQIGIEIIAVSVVALGTSLPELFVTVSAARRGKPEIAIGNILGSNIFNTFVVMGIPGLIGTLTIPKNMLTFSLPIMLIATFMYFFITQDKQITKWEGLLLLLFYVLFIGKLFLF